LVEQKNIEQIIIATPSAKAREMRKIVSYCETTGVDFKTVPGPRELMNGNVTLNQLRDLKIEDLLGRDAVNTDGERIAEMIRGRVVMVTGAGGSMVKSFAGKSWNTSLRNLSCSIIRKTVCFT